MRNKNQNNLSDLRVAYFITPHGFGHAARSAAIMLSLQRLYPGIHLEVFTLVPEWFFSQTLHSPFGYHRCNTDIGVVQASPLVEDLSATVKRLDEFMPFHDETLASLSQLLVEKNCAAVVCDIAPLGIAVAKKCSIPALLVENFTWDWIYEGYINHEPGLAPFITYLHEVFNQADYHIQTQPICHWVENDLVTFPVGRLPRKTRRESRTELGIPEGKPAVLVTMGGIPEQFTFLSNLQTRRDITFILLGAATKLVREDNLILLPHKNQFYHPDLVVACDAVIGKVGYSTLAETYYGGVPFGYVPRTHFRESDALVRFIEKHIKGLCINEENFQSGNWLKCLDELLHLPRVIREHPNGADQAARLIYQVTRNRSD